MSSIFYYTPRPVAQSTFVTPKDQENHARENDAVAVAVPRIVSSQVAASSASSPSMEGRGSDLRQAIKEGKWEMVSEMIRVIALQSEDIRLAIALQGENLRLDPTKFRDGSMEDKVIILELLCTIQKWEASHMRELLHDMRVQEPSLMTSSAFLLIAAKYSEWELVKEGFQSGFLDVDATLASEPLNNGPRTALWYAVRDKERVTFAMMLQHSRYRRTASRFATGTLEQKLEILDAIATVQKWNVDGNPIADLLRARSRPSLIDPSIRILLAVKWRANDVVNEITYKIDDAFKVVYERKDISEVVRADMERSLMSKLPNMEKGLHRTRKTALWYAAKYENWKFFTNFAYSETMRKSRVAMMTSSEMRNKIETSEEFKVKIIEEWARKQRWDQSPLPGIRIRSTLGRISSEPMVSVASMASSDSFLRDWSVLDF